ncbi:MAG: hypothetical protein IPL40_11675 [Proteobacteria bacterium]|nr:hypothetical protein [Pseudomonadota bacterium]
MSCRAAGPTVLLALALAFAAPPPAAAAGDAVRWEMLTTAGFGDDMTCLAVSHRDPNFVLAGTFNGKLYRTTDGGKTWQEITVTPYRTLFFGRERQPDSRLEYALGLPGKSPLLQRWLRGKGLHTSGVNLQQLLVQKGDKIVGINWIEFEWADDSRVYIGTSDGLYRSTDRGRTFFRIWQGIAGQAERMVYSVASDPFEPRNLLVGTASGLFISHDRGITLEKEMNFYIRDSAIYGLFYDPQAKGLLHMAMSGAAMASPDGGKNWITTYWDQWPPRSDVHWITLGPNNVRALGTMDGIFASWQGGEYGTWSRRGRRFVGEMVSNLLITKRPEVWYALTEIALWRTSDAGNTWNKVLQLGGGETGRWIEAFESDENQLWVLTNRRILRLRTGDDDDEATLAHSPFSRRLLDLPDLWTFWRKTLEYKQVYFRDNQAYRDRAPWAAMLPELTVGATYEVGRELRLVRAYPYLLLPFLYHNRFDPQTWRFEVMANWDLSRLVFDRRSLPHFGRIEGHLDEERQKLAQQVQRLYAEYRSAAYRLVHAAPASLLEREHNRLRLQEIAAYFDAISGGYWSKATGGVL